MPPPSAVASTFFKITINYKNGFSVNYVYDELDRIEEVWYNNNGVETKAFECFLLIVMAEFFIAYLILRMHK